jgi:hypothetical protein
MNLTLTLIGLSLIGNQEIKPTSEYQRVQSLWPEGAPSIEGVRFYRKAPASQHLIVLNSRPYRGFHSVASEPDSSNRLFPWRVAGGMHWAPRSAWRSATGIKLPPGGKIDVWIEDEYVASAAPPGPFLPKLRWRFPDETVLFDILIAKDKDGVDDHIFEVRTRTKVKKKWVPETFRPDPNMGHVSMTEGTEWTFGGNGSLETAGMGFDGRARYRHRIIPFFDKSPRFVRTGRMTRDKTGFIPKDYVGTGLSCFTCHTNAGAALGYGDVVRGDDECFSWHPVREDAIHTNGFGSNNQALDTSWPLNRDLSKMED